MEKETVEVGCACGKFRGTLGRARAIFGNHFVCMCDDCQAWAHHLGQAETVLDAYGGTDIVPTMPADLKFNQGLEHLRCARFTEKGLYRWYVTCCNSPIANSMTSSAGYIGLLAKSIREENAERVLGPAKGYMMAKWGIPPLPAGAAARAPMSLIIAAIKGLVMVHLTRQTKPSPLFRESGDPMVKPEIIPAEEWQSLKARVAKWRAAKTSQAAR